MNYCCRQYQITHSVKSTYYNIKIAETDGKGSGSVTPASEAAPSLTPGSRAGRFDSFLSKLLLFANI